MSGSVQPLVSFVMAVWNPRRDWLLQAVDSVLRQRECRLELIVVDDGCPEPVADLLTGIDDHRMRILRVPHGGQSMARNAGIASSAGGFIRFADSDDVVELGSTARLLTLAGDADEVVSYGATLVCDEHLRPIWKMTSRLEGDAVVDCLLGRFTVRPQSLLFPRRVVERTDGLRQAAGVSEDWDFVLRTLEHARVRGEQAVATYYRRHGGGVTTRVDQGLAGARFVVDAYFERHLEQRGTKIERLANARLEAMAARVYLTHGRPGEAFGRLADAMRLHPHAVIDELRLSLPALAGRAGGLVGRRRPAA